ncbi:GNAT family N-acetyltransferase [Actinotalea sp. M2MS4P-6]|uniref:GNAT family N-acetyltransferase n=1 Tax=Actinotalea sp. M2MS4P-6 TaxID=2983762 RepID=UPI0021E4B812|nr:GNAT family N-acetyltransferase [Actinotalea sp. M2MS4P-6]MCV2394247.1 GNAT family N-acetyltransferase [Actinotalea sp. M2MS4P-6]
MIRAARPTDADALADVCLRTALSGEDATGRLTDDRLWADLFALPYLELEPDLCWVVELGGSVVGYLVGTADTAAYAESFRDRWLPRLDGRYPLDRRTDPLEDQLVRELHDPERDLLPELVGYPAHLHVDLLAPARSRGWGRALLATFFSAVRDRGVPGVHLAVAPDNHRAMAFYSYLGLRELPTVRGTYLVATSDLL